MTEGTVSLAIVSVRSDSVVSTAVMIISVSSYGAKVRDRLMIEGGWIKCAEFVKRSNIYRP